MPVLYEEGVLKEHLHCRTHASMFDVSHMGQVSLTGPDRLRFIERMTVGDIKSNEWFNLSKVKGTDPPKLPEHVPERTGRHHRRYHHNKLPRKVGSEVGG